MVPERPLTPSTAGPAGPVFEGPIHAVIFDMDGLLLNTEVLALEGLRLAGVELGLEMDEQVCHLMIGVPAEVCRRLLLDRFGAEASADSLLAAAARHLRSQIDRGLMQLKPGASELLDYLDRKNLPRALATSSAREKALHHLEAAGIAARFDTIVTRDDVTRGKPFPDIYEQAARRLSLPPRHCLALEDSYNGVRAAASAGAPVIMVPDVLPPTAEMQQKCLTVLHDLHAVLRWLQRDAGGVGRASAGRAGTLIATADAAEFGADRTGDNPPNPGVNMTLDVDDDVRHQGSADIRGRSGPVGMDFLRGAG